jgi:hypothetical protein
VVDIWPRIYATLRMRRYRQGINILDNILGKRERGVEIDQQMFVTPKKARRLKKMVLMFDHAMNIDCISMRMLWCQLAPVSRSMRGGERNVHSRARRSREGHRHQPLGCYHWRVHALGLGLRGQPTQPEWWAWMLRPWYQARS